MAKTKRIDRKYANGKFSATEIATGNTFSVDIEDLFPGVRKAVAKLPNSSLLISGDDENRDLLSKCLNDTFGDTAADPTKDMVSVMNARLEAMKSGNYSMRGAGGGGARVTIFHQALLRYSESEDMDQIVAYVDSLSKKAKDDLRKNPHIDKIIRQIKVERENERLAKAGDLSDVAAPTIELPAAS